MALSPLESRRLLRGRVASTGPIVAATILYALTSGTWTAAGAVLAIVASFVASGPPSTASPTGERLLAIAAAATGSIVHLALLRTSEDHTRLGGAWAAVALAALLVAASRLFLHEPRGGAKVTVAVALLAVLACGSVQTGPLYAIFVAVSLGLAVPALRAVDPSRPGPTVLQARGVGFAALVGGVAIALAGGTAAALPELHGYVVKQFEHAALRRSKTGFSDRMRLGGMEEMIVSDTVVFRVYGPETDYLRGAVYDRYEDGRWFAYNAIAEDTPPPPHSLPVGRGRPEGGDVIEMRRVSGDRLRFFLPLEARKIATRTGAARVDELGAMHPSNGEANDVVWFSAGPRELAVPSAPSPSDRMMLPAIQPTLHAIATAWTLGADTDEEKLEAIRLRLARHYDYSLRSEHSSRLDPVLDFLLERPFGHCEYFASSFALLARSIGIATRVVAGYRVAERNPIGGYHLVRESNAHAWVEAHVGGRWRTYDPTPSSDLRQNQPRSAGIVSALFDVVASELESAGTWLGDRTAGQLFASGGAIALALLSLLAWIRRGRAKDARRELRIALASRPAHQCLERLLDALAVRGEARPPWEPLERFASRLRGSAYDAAATLLARYSALRYGGLGDETELASAIEAEIGELSRPPAER